MVHYYSYSALTRFVMLLAKIRALGFGMLSVASSAVRRHGGILCNLP